MQPSRFIALLLVIGSALVPALVDAQPSGAIVALHFQDAAERRVVAAVSDRGIVFIGDDLQPFRAFRSRALTSEGEARPFFWFGNVDEDRHDEYVFGGDPSFLLDQGGDPYFGVLQGCQDFFVGNILENEMVEVFCRRRNTLTVWNYDGQFLWEYSLTGRRIGTCVSDDVDEDERLEFVCTSGDIWLLVDIEHEETVREMEYDPAEVVAENPFERWASDTQRALSGEQAFDLTGDRSADETLLWNAGALSIMDATGTTIGSVTLPESEIFSVATGDLNSDGTPEIFLGGRGKIYVVSPTGEILSEVEGNPNSLSRDARVSIQSAVANGLEDSSAEATRGAVEDGLGRVQRCYRDEMGSDQFIRVGSIFYELTIDGRGRVSRSQRIHSGVNSEDLESCVENALEAMRFSSAVEDTGSVSVRLGFDFVDR